MSITSIVICSIDCVRVCLFLYNGFQSGASQQSLQDTKFAYGEEQIKRDPKSLESGREKDEKMEREGQRKREEGSEDEEMGEERDKRRDKR